MINMIEKLNATHAYTIGTVIGLSISAVLFFTVPVYHAYMLWSLSHFWWLTAIGAVGAYFAYRFD